jgi:hypothetical protein
LNFDVLLAKVIDPAHGANFTYTAPAGQRYVGVEITVTNHAKAVLTNDADASLSLIGNNDQTYGPDFAEIVGCSNFNTGTYTVFQGQAATGCVVFSVPDGVTVAYVLFVADDGAGGSRGTVEWKVS